MIYHFTQFLTLPRGSTRRSCSSTGDHFEIAETFHAGAFGYRMAALRRENGPPPDGRCSARARAARASRYGRPTNLGVARYAMLRRDLALRPVSRSSRRGGTTRSRFPCARSPSIACTRRSAGILAMGRVRRPQVTFGTPCRRRKAHSRLRAPLEPQRKLVGGGWFELDLPLDAFAGREACSSSPPPRTPPAARRP